MSYCGSRIDFTDELLHLLERGFTVNFAPITPGSTRVWVTLERNSVSEIAVGKPIDALRLCVEKWKRDGGVL